MAKDSSFAVVSTVDMQEVDNAYQQTVRELAKRWNRLDEKHEAMRELYDDLRMS